MMNRRDLFKLGLIGGFTALANRAAHADVTAIKRYGQNAPSSIIDLWSWEVAATGWTAQNGGFASDGGGAWPSANRAIFVPFWLDDEIVVDRMSFLNGTNVSGNLDLGIYNSAGVRLCSAGSTAQSGAFGCQTANMTSPAAILPGLNYLAAVLDNTSGQNRRMTAQSIGALTVFGQKQMDTAFPLPSTATFARATDNYMPVIAAYRTGS